MKLTAEARAKLPTSSFAGPQRSFPIQDAAHARNALSRAHFAANPGAIRAAVHQRFPDIGSTVRGLLRQRQRRGG